jgi:alcohol dehydrogenase class IV
MTGAPFEFATAGRILFGVGKAAELPKAAAALGQQAFVITATSSPQIDALLAGLRQAGLTLTVATATGEPSVDDIQAKVALARAHACDLIIAIGGGSAIDSGKAVGALLTNPGDPLDYLEVVGLGKPLRHPSAPVIAVPTTAGTGAEVTRNAVLAVPTHQVKVSLRSPTMLPRLALIDPELTCSMPPAITAGTGLDALTQCIEPFVSAQANPLTDGFARTGMAAAAKSLRRVYQFPDDLAARTDMALASLCGGLALANAKLGAVHGFAGVLGGLYPIPHGIACARLLPFVFATNVAALRTRAPTSPLLARFDEIGQILTGTPAAGAADAVTWIDALCAELDVAPLGAFGVQPDHFEEIIVKAKPSSSMQGNPLVLTDAELAAILAAAI